VSAKCRTGGDEAAGAARGVRHFVAPTTFAGRLHAARFTLMRRAVQFGVLLCLYGTLHWGWTVVGRPLLAGTLSASNFLGAIPLADPFAALQILASGHVPALEVVLGASIVLAVYLVLGGRVFCAWVCPMNVVTDAASSLRERLGVRDLFHLTPRARYWVLALALALSVTTGVAAFEWVSPIGILHRELVYGIGLGFVAVAGVFVFDLLVLRHGWCGHLCPLGAFWALGGRVGQVRVAFDDASCTHCGDCVKVCPEPAVLNFTAARERGMIAAGECTNCGRCVAVCPEGSLDFAWRSRIARPATSATATNPH
jgi:ferredoxin-type protein NapH